MPEVTRCQIQTVGGLSPLGDLMFCKKTLHRQDVWMGTLLWWSCQSPVAQSCDLLNHPNNFCEGMFKLNAKFDADWSLYSLRHCDYDSHILHRLTQWCLPPPLTSTVKPSFFTHAPSSPFFLVARLHRCHSNHSCYINNSLLFPERIYKEYYSIIKIIKSCYFWQHR